MRKLLVVIAMVVGLMAFPALSIAASPSSSSAVIYDSTVNPLPPSLPSQAFQAQQTAEFGDLIQFAGTRRVLNTVTVTMVTWAPHSDYPDMPTDGWAFPITLNIYSVDNSGTVPATDALLATASPEFTIPWRPAADPGCPSGKWMASDGNCYNGYAFNITFDMSSVNLTLPEQVIFGIAYNTQTWGYHPIGAPGPYNSLNVGLNDESGPSVGTDVNPDAVFWNTSTASNYHDGNPGGTFRQASYEWTGYVPAVQFTASPSPAPQWKTFGDGAWQPHQGNNSQHGLVTSSDANGSYGGIQLLNGPTDPASITAASFDFKADHTGDSGGSPRLVIEFSDGGNAQLRPLTWTADTWTTEDGFGVNASDWDNSGGTCGFLYETTYTTASACHAGTTITAIFLVNDSGWKYPNTGETVVVDNIMVNSIVAAGPGKSS